MSKESRTIYGLWRESTCIVSYWSTLKRAIDKVGKILGKSREELKFDLTPEGQYVIDGNKNGDKIYIMEIKLDPL